MLDNAVTMPGYVQCLASTLYIIQVQSSSRFRLIPLLRLDHLAPLASYLKPVLGHAVLVLCNEVGAVLLGVVGFGEEHAFVAGGFLVGAYAAWLFHNISPSPHPLSPT